MTRLTDPNTHSGEADSYFSAFWWRPQPSPPRHEDVRRSLEAVSWRSLWADSSCKSGQTLRIQNRYATPHHAAPRRAARLHRRATLGGTRTLHTAATSGGWRWARPATIDSVRSRLRRTQHRRAALHALCAANKGLVHVRAQPHDPMRRSGPGLPRGPKRRAPGPPARRDARRSTLRSYEQIQSSARRPRSSPTTLPSPRPGPARPGPQAAVQSCR